MVPLAEGCFLQGQVANLGPHATGFIQRAFPLFSAPWRVKLALEASGVPGCTEVTPAAVRCASWPGLSHVTAFTAPTTPADVMQAKGLISS